MKIRKQQSLSALVLGLLLAISGGSATWAELTVIYDSGQTQPLAPLLRPLLADETLSAESVEASDPHRSSNTLLGSATLTNLLPIRSPGLAAGDTADSQ